MARQTHLHAPHPPSANQGANHVSYLLAQVAIRNSPARGLTSRHLERRRTYPSPRLGRTTTPVQTCASATPSSLSSEHEWDSSSSNGSSESDSEHEDQAEHYTLPHEHEWHKFRSDLLQLAHPQLEEFSSLVEYEASSRTRSRVFKWQPEPSLVEEAQDPSDPEVVVLSRQRKMKRQFHQACPFYKSDPVKHKQCLLLYNSQSIEGLKHHLARHHKKPFYCARCFEIFKTPITRDSHILDAKCQLLDPKPMDGVDQYQRSMLWKKDKWYLSERKRWRWIWTVVFPAQPPRSPYLDQGLGLEVSMARDFWDMYGWRCVSNFLTGRGFLNQPDENDERALDALCDLVLEDLLTDIIERDSPTSNC